MKSTFKLPHELFAGLFENVQMSKIFPDSKTFVDCIPKKAAEKVMEAYRSQKELRGFDLAKFLHTYFELPVESANTFQSNQNQSTSDHIQNLWSRLQRSDLQSKENGSLLPLKKPYIVPGGRFREVYYWDSYFTMLGLALSDKVDLIGNMVQNFADQIDMIGFIPNGNRTYFLSRSQPPFFSFMVELLASYQGEEIIRKYSKQLLKEYNFWMDGPRVVEIGVHGKLNRYFDNLNIPRAESYEEDVALANQSENKELNRNLRAACESGWDFSTRWLRNPLELSTIQATSILPVDLNCLLLNLERVLEKAMLLEGKEDESNAFQQASFDRIAAIQHYFWDSKSGFYRDYDIDTNQQTGINSLAGLFPLFVGISNEDQAKQVIDFASKKLLMPGGWSTTDVHSGQQWDAPNGWAPLQWIVHTSLKNYGFEKLAIDTATRWLDLNDRVFKRTGKMMEKYNVEDLSLDAGGGEYPVQDGFGWTNGVYLALLNSINRSNIS